MAYRELPALNILRQLLSYSPETGIFHWKARSAEMFAPNGGRDAEGCCSNWNAKHAGKRAGSLANGYTCIRINGVSYQAHRIAYFLFHGEHPCEQIDHINGNRSDNKISNLRSVDNATNSRNTGLRGNNTTGVVGVQFHKRNGKKPWVAGIKLNGTQHYLGSFAKEEDAILARKKAEKLMGYHDNHGTRAATPNWKRMQEEHDNVEV